MSQKTRSLRWAVAGLLFLSTGINYLDRQTLSILASTVQAELKIDDMGYAGHHAYFYIFIVFSVFPLLAFLAVKLLIGNLGEIPHSLDAGNPTGSIP